MNNFNINQDKPIASVRPSYVLLVLMLLLSGKSVIAAPEREGSAVAEGEVTIEPAALLSAAELVDLVAPIALYPDDLLAIVLPAASYPIQIVQAARFLKARENDPGLEPNQGWDDAIIALLNYPEIIALLNQDLDWTWRLGEAVLNQESGLIVAVSDFRERARVAGNLVSDEHQIVELDDGGAIEIKPVDPEVIYVPYYEPEQVTIYQPQPVYHYYPQAYPVYYYPFPADYRFSTFFWGVTSVFSIGWNTHHLHLHHYGYDTHPYYDHHYYIPFYHRHPQLWLSDDYSRHDNHYKNRHQRHHPGNQWQPDRARAGSRPHDPDVAVNDWRAQRRSDHRPRDRRREETITKHSTLEKSELIQRAAITRPAEVAGASSVRSDRARTRRNKSRVDRQVDRDRTVGNNSRLITVADDSSRKHVSGHRGVGRDRSHASRAVREVRAQSTVRAARQARQHSGESRQRSHAAVADSATRPRVASVQPARVVQTKVVRRKRAQASVPATAPATVKYQSYASRSRDHGAKQSRNQEPGRRRDRH